MKLQHVFIMVKAVISIYCQEVALVITEFYTVKSKCFYKLHTMTSDLKELHL